MIIPSTGSKLISKRNIVVYLFADGRPFMRKYLQGFLMLLLLFAIFGCGDGATSGDPLGTDSITVAASATSVSVGQESVITATVVRLDKSPATDRSVSFSFSTNHSGGTLRVVNSKVDGQSKAVAVYTAGSNSPADVVTDTIQVSLSNGAGAVVVITREGVTPSRVTLTLTANPSSVTVPFGGGDFSTVLTATIKDSKGNPVSGVNVDIQASPGGATVSVITGDDGLAIKAYNASATSGAIVFVATAPALNISASTSVMVTEEPEVK
jgi:hypothetical protein